MTAKVEAFAKLPFPRKLSRLEQEGLALGAIENAVQIRRIRNSRNSIVHRRGFAQAIIAQVKPQAHENFELEVPSLSPLAATVPFYTAAMEHVLTYCAFIDAAAQKLFNLPATEVTAHAVAESS